jgi:hypothetical protein
VNYWSETYQWLPANVAFQDDDSVKFTRYVNNLQPVKYPDIYQTIEKLIETVLPAWDKCLLLSIDSWGFDKVGAGRLHTRFSKSMPEDLEYIFLANDVRHMAIAHLDNSDDNPDNWDPSDLQELADAAVD